MHGKIRNYERYMQKKENKTLREDINPIFKHNHNINKIIDFVDKSTMQPETKSHYAKFKIIDHVKRMNKYFHEAAIVVAVYSKKDDDIYWLNWSTLGENFLKDYYKKLGRDRKKHSPFNAMRAQEVLYVDYTNPIVEKDSAEFMTGYGFLSAWYIPIQLKGVLIGCLSIGFKYQIGRLPDEAELSMIRSELEFLEDEFHIMIAHYEDSQDVSAQRKVGR